MLERLKVGWEADIDCVVKNVSFAGKIGGRDMRLFTALTSLLPVACLLVACQEQQQPAPEPVVQFQRVSANNVEHGQRVADVLGCTGCHGEDLTGRDWSEPGFGRLWTANLSRSIAEIDDNQLAELIKTGARPDRELWGMPSHLFTHLSADDMSALIAYLRSVPPSGEIHPEPAFEEGARQEIAAGTFQSAAADVREQGTVWPPEAGAQHQLARYIVRATCAECHGIDLRGGTPFPGAAPRPDLRIVAAYDLEQFRHLLRDGKAIGEREVGLMSEVARGRYKHLTDAEIAAVHSYLRDVAAVDP